MACWRRAHSSLWAKARSSANSPPELDNARKTKGESDLPQPKPPVIQPSPFLLANRFAFQLKARRLDYEMAAPRWRRPCASVFYWLSPRDATPPRGPPRPPQRSLAVGAPGSILDRRPV